MVEKDSAAYDFYESIADNAPIDLQFSRLQAYCRHLGYPNLFYSRRIDPNHPAPSSLENRFILTRDDDGWFETYMDERFYNLDFYQKYTNTVRSPFVFELRKDMTETQIKWANDAKVHRSLNGFGLPVANSGKISGFSATGGLRPPSRLEIVKMTSMVGVFHNFLSGQLDAEAQKRFNLTPKAITRMRWLSIGKTSKDIAEIEGASEDSIRNYFAYLRDKFNCTNNVQLGIFFRDRGLLD